VRVLADSHTHTHTQMQTDFIICPMLYAIAMGQIITVIVTVIFMFQICIKFKMHYIYCW